MYGTLMYGMLKSWRIDLRSAPLQGSSVDHVLFPGKAMGSAATCLQINRKQINSPNINVL
jgi:hypothetical protein